ncbi:MAG: hypothetical protein LBM96_07440 [Methanobrevibacter sp.]|jgi:uncharacterized membrane protein|nr:hypothetical protein [Candidatus Methanoflexus mossambicus]
MKNLKILVPILLICCVLSIASVSATESDINNTGEINDINIDSNDINELNDSDNDEVNLEYNITVEDSEEELSFNDLQLDSNSNSNSLMSSSSFTTGTKNIYYTYQGVKYLVAKYRFVITNPGTSSAVGHFYVRNEITSPLDFGIKVVARLYFSNGNIMTFNGVVNYEAGVLAGHLVHIQQSAPYLDTISINSAYAFLN